MDEFEKYYKTRFKKDLDQFFDNIPEKSKFHEDKENKRIYSIQYHRLTNECDHLNFLSKDRKELFGVALYFIVLQDMECFTHFKEYYQKFQNLTRYPKFIGDCPGACHFHFHPRDILRAMNKNFELSSQGRLDFDSKFKEAVPVMRTMTIEFINKNIDEVNAQDFWVRCEKEFPFNIIGMA